MIAACAHCNDTGSASKTLWGDLDCTHCEAPAERLALRVYVSERTGQLDEESFGWACFLLGRAARQKSDLEK